MMCTQWITSTLAKWRSKVSCKCFGTISNKDDKNRRTSTKAVLPALTVSLDQRSTQSRPNFPSLSTTKREVLTTVITPTRSHLPLSKQSQTISAKKDEVIIRCGENGVASADADKPDLPDDDYIVFSIEKDGSYEVSFEERTQIDNNVSSKENLQQYQECRNNNENVSRLGSTSRRDSLLLDKEVKVDKEEVFLSPKLRLGDVLKCKNLLDESEGSITVPDQLSEPKGFDTKINDEEEEVKRSSVSDESVSSLISFVFPRVHIEAIGNSPVLLPRSGSKLPKSRYSKVRYNCFNITNKDDKNRRRSKVVFPTSTTSDRFPSFSDWQQKVSTTLITSSRPHSPSPSQSHTIRTKQDDAKDDESAVVGISSRSSNNSIDLYEPDLLPHLPDDDYIAFCIEKDGSYRVTFEESTQSANISEEKIQLQSEDCRNVTHHCKDDNKNVSRVGSTSIQDSLLSNKVVDEEAVFRTPKLRLGDMLKCKNLLDDDKGSSTTPDQLSISKEIDTEINHEEEQVKNECNPDNARSSVSDQSISTSSSFSFPRLESEWIIGSPVMWPRSEKVVLNKRNSRLSRFTSCIFRKSDDSGIKCVNYLLCINVQ